MIEPVRVTVTDLRTGKTKPLRKTLDRAWHETNVQAAVRAESERCAKIIEGETFKEVYRTWPWWGSGNRANDSEMVRFCDAAAAAIREEK